MFKHIVSLSVLAGLLISILPLTVPMKSVSAAGTIYIRADGSIDPISASIFSSDMMTYTFTANIQDSIVVERNNIVIDGSGHVLSGTGSGSGIDLTGTSNVTIQNVEIKDFGWGIASNLGGSSSNNEIVNSQIVNNGDGIVLYSSTDYVITKNEITGSTFQDGIWLYACADFQVVGNDISANQRGGVVFATSSEDNLVSDNSITGNGIGILFDSGANKVIHNNIVDNTIQAIKRYSTSYANVWDDGYPSCGNYWSDYIGVDAYHGSSQDIAGSDGIGDTPYTIDENNIDHYPLMSPWTPVITATVDFQPDTLNLRSNGKWVTCYIELPDGNNVANIKVSTIKLNATVSAELKPTGIGDYDNDAIPDLMVKFDRAKVTEYILNSVSMTGKFVTVTLVITGKLNAGISFQGSDTIKTLSKS